jgi:hypothetical protein
MTGRRCEPFVEVFLSLAIAVLSTLAEEEGILGRRVKQVAICRKEERGLLSVGRRTNQDEYAYTGARFTEERPR